MASTRKRIGPTVLGDAAATLYTAPAGTKSIVKNIHISNPAGGVANAFTLSIGADAAGTRIYSGYPLPAPVALVTPSVFDTFDPFVLDAAEILQGFAATGGVLIFEAMVEEVTLG